mmetsp:Transcript_65113/g.115717  ORF Transcript_65113/g.115717 Transcript_65113/m.115717 type:complete len:129 (-) Transcript_65113:559-945(-)
MDAGVAGMGLLVGVFELSEAGVFGAAAGPCAILAGVLGMGAGVDRLFWAGVALPNPAGVQGAGVPVACPGTGVRPVIEAGVAGAGFGLPGVDGAAGVNGAAAGVNGAGAGVNGAPPGVLGITEPLSID